jgi:phytoene dehydrogenase-like protein
VSVTVVDAVVIGSGPNGLVAANALVDAGWDVLVLEAQETVGGAVRSAEVTAPGYSTDLFSAFYPLAAASPVIKGLDLEHHGLHWLRAPTALAHVLEDGRAAVLSTDLATTAAGLDAFAPGDGQAWVDMFTDWQRIRDPLLDALFTPFPPVRAALGLLRRLRVAGTMDLARLAVLPVRRLAAETFRGEGGGLLLTGNAMHSDIPPDAAGSGVFGWLLTMLAQDVGFPVPRGGAGMLSGAMRSRIVSRGGQIRTGTAVTSIEINQGRATGVRCANGDLVTARRAVLADVSAPSLFRDLVGLDRLPAAVAADLDRFQWDHATFKINWALDRPIGWRASGAHGAGTVHFGANANGFVDHAADLSVGRLPRRPFALLGQMTTADPTRSPAGTESAWAYTHVPQGLDWTPTVTAEFVDRIQSALEDLAPGFTASIVASHVQRPPDLEAADANLVGGATNGGSARIHQQLFFRPTPGTGRPETPIPGLFLASASAHPGGGVHGACGWNAALSALRSTGRTGGLRRTLSRTAWDRILGASTSSPGRVR